MKIASYKDGSRDGQLVVVSRDLTMAHYATATAGRLQQVLDDWNFLSPQLEELSQTLNHGKARHAFPFDPRLCMAPLPRSTYLAATRPDPDSSAASLTVRLGHSDDLLGACDPVRLAPIPATDHAADADGDAAKGLGLMNAPQLAVITADLAAGCAADDAPSAIRLLMASVFWYRPMPSDTSWGQPISASFSPVAVTADELGASWQSGSLDLAPQLVVNGKRVTIAIEPNGNWLAPRHIGACLADCATLRSLRAGSIVGVGLQAGGRSDARAGDSFRFAFSGGANGDDKLFGAIDTQVESLQ